MSTSTRTNRGTAESPFENGTHSGNLLLDPFQQQDDEGFFATTTTTAPSTYTQQQQPLPPPPPQQQQQHHQQHIQGMVMERVLFQLHLRMCQISLRHTSARTRRLVEHLLLVVAIAGFSALVLLHRNFVFRVTMSVQPSSSSGGSETTVATILRNNCAVKCLASIPNFDPTADIYHIHLRKLSSSTSDDSTATIGTMFFASLTSNTTRIQSPSNSYVQWEGEWLQDTTEASQQSSSDDNLTCSQESQGRDHPLPPPSYSYSITKAYLLLPPKHFLLQSLRVQHIFPSPYDSNCFGEPFLQALIHDVVGYDTLVINWLLAALQQQQQQKQQPYDTVGPTTAPPSIAGHLFHARTGRLQELKLPMPQTPLLTLIKATMTTYSPTTGINTTTSPPSWSPTFSSFTTNIMGISKIVVLLQTTVLFFFCTTLVSFTLRETQERMLEFTQELRRRVSVSLPLVDLVVHHLIHNNLVFVPIMVGMMFFLIEFYSGDKFLAFFVMSIVWCVEVFSVISLRSYQGIAFFPRMFFLLFCLFHIYYFANPNGFIYTALLVMGCTMTHSMLFFWHRYELPAVALGLVTVERPRINYYPSPLDQQTERHNGSPLTTTLNHHLFQPDPNLAVRSYSPLQNDHDDDAFGRMGSAGATNNNTNDNNAGEVQQHLRPQSPPQIRMSNPPPSSVFEPRAQAFTSTSLSNSNPSSSSYNNYNNNNAISFARSHNNSSFSTTSSRNSSGNLFRAGVGRGTGDEDDDDDDDSSYAFFLNGEVVLRPRQVNEAIRNDATEPNSHSQREHVQDHSSSLQYATNSVGLDVSNNSYDEDDNAVAPVSLPLSAHSTTSTLYHSPNRYESSSSHRNSYSQEEQYHSHSAAQSEQEQLYSAEESASGLQAILEFSRTPRHSNNSNGSRSSQTNDSEDGAPVEVETSENNLPMFPTNFPP